MPLHLTPEEQEDLIWQEGDHLEVLPGTVTFTQQRQLSDPKDNQATILARFFFESEDSDWGEREWVARLGSEIPNGPALLVLYRRADRANVFGIVSMGSRAWTYNGRLRDMALYKDSGRHAKIARAERNVRLWLGIAFVAISLPTMGIGAILVLGLSAVPAIQRKAHALTGGERRDRYMQQVLASARSAMHRLAKTAEDHWPGGGTASGRL